MRHFPEEFQAHIHDSRCPAGSCNLVKAVTSA